MSLFWDIGLEQPINDIVEAPYRLESEEDNLPYYLPNFLLDIKLYQQLRLIDEHFNLSSRNFSQEANNIIALFFDIYSRTNEIITQNRIDLISINNRPNPIDDDASSYLNSFIDEINKWLSNRSNSRVSAPDLNPHVPNSINRKTRERIEKIINLTNTNTLIDDKPHSVKYDITRKKYKVKRELYNIPIDYSEELNDTFKYYKALKKTYKIPATETELLKFLLCPQKSDSTKEKIINTLEQKTMDIYMATPSISNLDDNWYPGVEFKSKAVLIDTFYSDYQNNVDGKLDQYTGKVKNYFMHPRCIGIMRFKDIKRNMFSISGIELDDKKKWMPSIQRIADIIQNALKAILGETYAFCPQTIHVIRYMHRDSYDAFTALPTPEMLKNDFLYKDHKWDYACCERKLLAKLFEDFNFSNIPYPKDIWLYSRFKICDNCRKGITDYELKNSMKFIEYVGP